MNSKIAISKLKCKPAEFSQAAHALGINPDQDISPTDCDRIEEYLTQPKAVADSGQGSSRVWADGFGQDADAAAQGQQAEQANPLVLAQLAGAAEQVALREARVQGGFEVTQATIEFIQGGGDLSTAIALLQQINDEQRIPQTDLPLPKDTTLAILTLRSAIAELRQRALAAPGFFALKPDGMFSLAQSTSRTPYDDAIRVARTSAPALRPAFPSTQRQLGGSQ